MMVGGRRIGQGSGANKKASMTSCYVDVTQYLEECDPELWKTFLDDAKTGKDLGVAHAFYFKSSNVVEEQVQDLCETIRRSTLYKRRPKIGSTLTGSDAPETSQSLLSFLPESLWSTCPDVSYSTTGMNKPVRHPTRRHTLE